MPRPDIAELAAWYGDPEHYDPRVLRALAYLAELEGLLREAHGYLPEAIALSDDLDFMGLPRDRRKIMGIDPTTGRIIYEDVAQLREIERNRDVDNGTTSETGESRQTSAT